MIYYNYRYPRYIYPPPAVSKTPNINTPYMGYPHTGAYNRRQFTNNNFLPNNMGKKDEHSSKKDALGKKISKKSNDDVLFEIFGIKLYFDDILLICLIFFLYNEGVKDQFLFIALILLLLS